MKNSQIKERPIIFSGAMVRAILDGKKTQTRRVIKPQPPHSITSIKKGTGGFYFFGYCGDKWDYSLAPWERRCPYGQSGDRLWVRETAYISPQGFGDIYDCTHSDYDNRGRIVAYCADYPTGRNDAAEDYGVKKTPSIFMPRWASRIMLEITDVRVERLQQIGGTDAWAEGELTVRQFIELWDSLNAKRGFGWEQNLWVWIIDFVKETPE